MLGTPRMHTSEKRAYLLKYLLRKRLHAASHWMNSSPSGFSSAPARMKDAPVLTTQ